MPSIPLAVVAALDDEIRIIRSRMDVDSRVHIRPSLFTLGQYEGKPLILVRGGMGMDSMRRAMEYLVERYRPDFCLHVGYCGGADPRYGPGDLVIAESVVDAKTGESYKPKQERLEQAEKLCKERGIRYRRGTLVSVAEMIESPHEKAFVGTQNEAQAIDMESAAFADVLSSNGMDYLIVRAVFDPLDIALPSLGDVVDDEGGTDTVALAGHVIKNPKDILRFPKLKYCAMQARQAITRFVHAWQGGEDE